MFKSNSADFYADIKGMIQEKIKNYYLCHGKAETENVIASIVDDTIKSISEVMDNFWKLVESGLSYFHTENSIFTKLGKYCTIVGYCSGFGRYGDDGKEVVVEKIYFNAKGELTVLVKDDNGTEHHVHPLDADDNYFLYIEEKYRSWLLNQVFPSYRNVLESNEELKEIWNKFLDISAKYIANRNCGDFNKTRDMLLYRLKDSSDLFDTIDIKF